MPTEHLLKLSVALYIWDRATTLLPNDRTSLERAPVSAVPTPLLQKQIEQLNRLPKTQQKIVMQMLDGVLSQTNRQSAGTSLA